MIDTAPFSPPIDTARAAVPPRARALPVVGSLPSLIRAPLAFLEEARAASGDVFRVDLGAFEVILLNHPRHAQHVLRDHADNYVKAGPAWDSIRALVGNGLPVSEGSYWLRQRRMMAPQFHRERLAAMTDLMVSAIDEEMATWGAASAQPFDIARALTRLTMKVIVRTMFGTSIDRDESDAVGEHLTYMLDFMLRGMVMNALPRWVPAPGRRRYEEAIAAVDAILFRVIARSREEGRASGSLIDVMLSLVDAETGARMTPVELRDEAVSMFLGGYETTAAALSFAFGYLVRDAGVSGALRAEVDAALGDRTPGFVDLKLLPYALGIVKEAMRLSPPVYWVPRAAVVDDVIDGFAIPAGATVAPVIYTIHRHPAQWPDAARFDPDRFLPEPSAGRHGLAWMPFGAGQRQCLAKEFALMEGQLILARIAQRYEVREAEGYVSRVQFSTTLRPRDGVMVRLGRRDPKQGERITSEGAPGTEAGPARAVVLKDTKVARGYPLVGGIVDIAREGPAFLTRIARAHPGEVVGFRIGPFTFYLVTHPDHVQHVLHDQWRSYGKGGMWEATKPLLGNGLAASGGAFWLRQRRLMQPLFNAAHLATLTDVMVDVIEGEVERLAARGSAPCDMGQEMNAMTQRVMLETLFGQGLDRLEMDRLGDEIQLAFASLNLRVFLYFLPERFPLPDERRYRAAIAAIDEATLRLIRARRAGGGQGDDLLSVLLRARDEDTGSGMDDRQLRDELVTMFVGGQETTAIAMTWLWYVLDQHPEVDRRLRAEIADVLGDRRPTSGDLARLVYTKRVTQEVLRLYPPGWMIPRFADEEAIIGGHSIPAGSPLLLSPFVSHRDPTFWPDPETFDPERFTPERSAGRPRYAYYPFGGGPRQCIGNHFTMMEAQLITAMMARRLRPRLVPGHRVALSSATTLKPRHGLKMTLGAV